jgi:hypothetical protein
MLLGILIIAPLCPAETLRHLLTSHGIPLTSFQESELSENVEGQAASNAQIIVLAYEFLKDKLLVVSLHMVSYNRASGAVIRRDLQVSETDICGQQLDGISFLEEFIQLSTSITPSAECLLLLDKNLQLRHTLYGFGAVLIAPGQIVMTENMIHFAPVHPERLQLVDLHSGATKELYPPKNDQAREQLANEHAKRMPSKEICMRMNDPCDPHLFDEDITILGTDGKGRFAFEVIQSASHATKEEEPPTTVASQTILYVYNKTGKNWHYCEKEISDSEIEFLKNSAKLNLDTVFSRCSPNLLVVPDLSTAILNPFFSRRAKP